MVKDSDMIRLLVENLLVRLPLDFLKKLSLTIFFNQTDQPPWLCHHTVQGHERHRSSMSKQWKVAALYFRDHNFVCLAIHIQHSNFFHLSLPHIVYCFLSNCFLNHILIAVPLKVGQGGSRNLNKKRTGKLFLNKGKEIGDNCFISKSLFRENLLREWCIVCSMADFQEKLHLVQQFHQLLP